MGRLTNFVDAIHSANRPFSCSAKEPGSSVVFIHFYVRLDQVALEPLSLLCTFENSTKFGKISFDSDYF